MNSVYKNRVLLASIRNGKQGLLQSIKFGSVGDLWFYIFRGCSFGVILLVSACLSANVQLQSGNDDVTRPDHLLTEKIVVNQLGYLDAMPKQAYIISDRKLHNHVQQVELVEVQTQRSIKTLKGTQCRQLSSLDRHVCLLDFSSVTTPGHYYLIASNATKGKERTTALQSIIFSINSDVYRTPLTTLLRSYYLQRCGLVLDDPISGISHSICHHRTVHYARADRWHQAGEIKNVTGGWHDAGDYGRYVATTTITIGKLLSLYQWMPDAFQSLSLSIPESTNQIPDLLDEVQVGLNWLLTMQREDGAVYRKVAGKKWPALIPPDRDDATQYLYGVSTPDTAKLAANMALAYRVFRQRSDTAVIAERYLKSAQQAWRFLNSHPEQFIDWHANDDGGSGPYQMNAIDQEITLADDKDDRLWAAIELYLSTGDSEIHTYISAHYRTVPYTLYEWKNPAPLGFLHYLYAEPSKTRADIRHGIAQKIIARADELVEVANQQSFSIANARFVWGSNKMTAEDGTTLFFAYQLTANRNYLRLAVQQLNYLLGANAFNQTFVTGLGARPVRHLNHIFARADKIDIPGLMVGGPNVLAQAGIAPKNQGQLSYIDDARSYAVNEYAIDYNAALIGLMALLQRENRLQREHLSPHTVFSMPPLTPKKLGE